MTDKEKALKLADLSKVPDDEDRYFISNRCEIYDKCLEIAAWKEEQMISQAKEFIAEYFYEHPHTSLLICSDEFQDLDDCFERLERYLKEED